MVAALVVLAVIVYVATGRGGELSAEQSDYAALDLGPVSATDVALLRPPTALWGYDVQATDEALERIAESIRARDVRIVALEQLVSDLGRNAAPQPRSDPAYASARHRRAGEFAPPTLPAILPVPPEGGGIPPEGSAVLAPPARPAPWGTAASSAAAASPAPGTPADGSGGIRERGASGGASGSGGAGTSGRSGASGGGTGARGDARERERGTSGGAPPERSHG